MIDSTGLNGVTDALSITVLAHDKPLKAVGGGGGHTAAIKPADHRVLFVISRPATAGNVVVCITPGVIMEVLHVQMSRYRKRGVEIWEWIIKNMDLLSHMLGEDINIFIYILGGGGLGKWNISHKNIARVKSKRGRNNGTMKKETAAISPGA